MFCVDKVGVDSLPRLTQHLIAGCQLRSHHSPPRLFLLVHPVLPSPHSPSCLSDGCLFLRQMPATPSGPTHPTELHSHVTCICPTINITSQSWQINLLVNGTQSPGLSLLLMSRLLCPFLCRLLPSHPSGWKEASGCRSFMIETLCGACDIQSSVAQTAEELFITNKCCGEQLGGPSSGSQGDESWKVMHATDWRKSTWEIGCGPCWWA